MMPEPLVVYYDASCPLCRTEIELLSSSKPGALALCDCSSVEFDDTEARNRGVTQRQLMRALHVRDASGRWHIGIDALAAVYDAAGFTRVSRLLANRSLRPLWQRCYRWFARHRHVISTFFGSTTRRRATNTAPAIWCDESRVHANSNSGVV